MVFFFHGTAKNPPYFKGALCPPLQGGGTVGNFPIRSFFSTTIPLGSFVRFLLNVSPPTPPRPAFLSSLLLVFLFAATATTRGGLEHPPHSKDWVLQNPNRVSFFLP